MRVRLQIGVMVTAALLLADSNGSSEQAPSEFARLLEEAKALFGQDELTEATARLQAALGLLDHQGSLKRRRTDLAAGCLELGFAYLRLRDHANARTAFECTLGLDRRWRLDPQISAAPAVVLFEEARASIEARPQQKP